MGLSQGGIALDRRSLHCNEGELAAFFEEPIELPANDEPVAVPAAAMR